MNPQEGTAQKDHALDLVMRNNTEVAAFQAVLVLKYLPANTEDVRCGFDSWVGKIP